MFKIVPVDRSNEAYLEYGTGECYTEFVIYSTLLFVQRLIANHLVVIWSKLPMDIY